jgi:hypothetical protein
MHDSFSTGTFGPKTYLTRMSDIETLGKVDLFIYQRVSMWKFNSAEFKAVPLNC